MGANHHIHIGPVAIVDDLCKDWCDFTEEHGEGLSMFYDGNGGLPSGRRFIVANVPYEGAPSIPRNDGLCGWFSVDKVDTAAEIAAFKKAFAVELAAMAKAYGPVSVEWGVLGGWS